MHCENKNERRDSHSSIYKQEGMLFILGLLLLILAKASKKKINVLNGINQFVLKSEIEACHDI
jgi:hypothetical protein